MKHVNVPGLASMCRAPLFLLFCITIASCSKKNDAPAAFVKAEELKLKSTDVNGCTLSSGSTGSRFNFAIPYTTSPGITIKKVEYSTKFSSGTTSEGDFDVSVDGTDGSVEFFSCIRFASTTWSERTYTLVSSNGVKSNPLTIKIDKPAGAE